MRRHYVMRHHHRHMAMHRVVHRRHHMVRHHAMKKTPTTH